MSVLISIASPMVTILLLWFELLSLIVTFVFISHSPTNSCKQTGNNFVLDSIVNTSHSLVLRSNTLISSTTFFFSNELIKYIFY